MQSSTSTTLFPFMYVANKIDITTGHAQTLFGCFQARHSFEALHNARYLVTERGASPRFIKIIKL